jgi:hypothetical protein
MCHNLAGAVPTTNALAPRPGSKLNSDKDAQGTTNTAAPNLENSKQLHQDPVATKELQKH